MRRCQCYALLMCLVASVLLASPGQRAFAQHEPHVQLRLTVGDSRGTQPAWCQGGQCKPLFHPRAQAVNLFNGVVIDVGPVGNGPGVTVLTCAHAFREQGVCEVQIAGGWRLCQLVATDPARDLALLWVPQTTAKAAPLADSDPEVGAEITLHAFDHHRGGQYRVIPGRLGKPARQSNGIARWESSGGAVIGYSGGAWMHDRKVIGIQIEGDNPVSEGVYQIGVLTQRESIEKFLVSTGAAIRHGHSDSGGNSEVRLFNEKSIAELQRELQQIRAELAEMKSPAEAKLLVEDPEPVLGEPSPTKPEEPVKDAPVFAETPGEPATPTPPALPADQEGSERAGATEGPVLGWLRSIARGQLSALGWAAVGAGTAGALGLLVPAAWRFIARRKSPEQRLLELVLSRSRNRKEAEPERQIPFPRFLDEADQLRRLRQSEGRVAALDALVGMLFDDEVKATMETAESPEEKQAVRRLRERIMDRVDQIAPIATPGN